MFGLLLLLLFQNLADLSNQASQAMKEKRYADAARIYRDIASRDPINPTWHFSLGLALASGSEHRAALAELNVYLKSRPEPGPAHYLAGQMHLKLGQPCEAIEPLQNARQWQTSAKVLMDLGDANFGCQRWDQAAVSYLGAAQFAPKDPLPPRQVARSWWKARQYEKALPLYVSTADNFTGEAHFQYEFGDTLARLHGPAAGLSRLERAVTADPKLLAARGSLGRALLELKRPADAIPHLEAASREDSALLLPLSQAYGAAGRTEDAARTLREYQRNVGAARK